MRKRLGWIVFIGGIILAFYIGVWVYTVSNLHLCIGVLLGCSETFDIEAVFGAKIGITIIKFISASYVGCSIFYVIGRIAASIYS